MRLLLVLLEGRLPSDVAVSYHLGWAVFVMTNSDGRVKVSSTADGRKKLYTTWLELGKHPDKVQ